MSVAPENIRKDVQALRRVAAMGQHDCVGIGPTRRQRRAAKAAYRLLQEMGEAPRR